jgi:hypothetical protein
LVLGTDTLIFIQPIKVVFHPKKPIMKRTIFIFILFGAFSMLLKAQYPIPSFNVPVYPKATFEEHSEPVPACDQVLEKRDIVIRSTCGFASAVECTATVYVYSLDGQNVLGPFTVHCNETLVVGIDSREWGVLIETNCEMTIDVWTEANPSDLLKKEGKNTH